MKTVYKLLRPHFFFVILFFVMAVLVAGVASKKQGPHGGVVKRAENYFIEMKSADRKLYVYLLEKGLKTISNKGLLAEADFFFPDSTVQNVPLKPENYEAFVCETPLNYHACKITFKVAGKLVFAKFNNPLKIVRHK